MADNELALPGGAINASTVSEALTKRLEDVLIHAADVKTAVEAIVATPALMDEAKTAVALVSRLAGPTSTDDLYIALQKLLVLYGPPDFGQDKNAAGLKKAWFAMYADVLCPHPLEAIKIAVDECIRIRKFDKFPTPGYLNELAEESAAEIKMIAFRLKKAVAKAAKPPPPPKRTPEESMEIAAIVADMKGADGKIRLAPKSIATVVPPTDRKATAEALRRLSDDFQ